MAVTSGFFDSVSGDRLYNADSFNSFIRGFITEGVLSTVGDSLIPEVTEGTFIVNVKSGKAWFNDTWINNSHYYRVDIPAPDPTYDRIDTIVLDFNKDERANTINLKVGTPAAVPQRSYLTDSPTNREIPIATVYVSTGAEYLTDPDLTVLIGTEECPFCTGLLQQLTIDELLAQWDAEFSGWMSGIENDLIEIDTTGTLAELDDIRERLPYRRNLLINGNFRICQYPDTSRSGITLGHPIYRAVADRWILKVGQDSGTFSISRTDLGNFNSAYKIQCTATGSQSVLASYVYLLQTIEGSTLRDLQKGTPDAREMTLSIRMKTNNFGSYILELKDVDNNRGISYKFTHSGSGDYQTFIWNIPADFVGPFVYDQSASLELRIWLGAGSNYTSAGYLNTTWNPHVIGASAYQQTNGADNVANYFEFSNIQLEVGPIATPFEYLSFEEELVRCRRYYEYYQNYRTIGVTNDVLSEDLNTLRTLFPQMRNYYVQKRVRPSVYWTWAGIVSNLGVYQNPTMTWMDSSYYDALTVPLGNGKYPDSLRQPEFYLTTVADLSKTVTHQVVFHDLEFVSELY